MILRSVVTLAFCAAAVAADLMPYKWMSPGTARVFPGESFPRRLGDRCERSVDCMGLGNSVCVDHRCTCINGYFPTVEDGRGEATCRPALDLGQRCRNASSSPQCRAPFVCTESKICGCPTGYEITNKSTCTRLPPPTSPDCSPDEVLIQHKNEDEQHCAPLQDLGGRCAHNEQCASRYAQCITGQCQCIPGTIRRQQQCVTIKQCPLGDAPLENGYPLICDRHTLKCPEGNYCLFAQFGDNRGFCCPTMTVHCPVGQPLAYSCVNCPWETHHCFTYSVGSHQQSMCCPNDCPRTLPIRKNDRCYAVAGHGQVCSVDEQCRSVQGAICGSNASSTGRVCRCPTGFSLADSPTPMCKRASKLGGECDSHEDCALGSNTACLDGYCRCRDDYVPEPAADERDVEHCIPPPACPSVNGFQAIDHYEDCSDKPECSEGKFCRRWYQDASKNRTYSLCCRIPSVRDYKAICAKFGMDLVHGNGLSAAPSDQQPFRCLLPTLGSLAAPGAGKPREAVAALCPADAACLYDPFSTGEGVCCRPKLVRSSHKPASDPPADNSGSTDAADS